MHRVHVHPERGWSLCDEARCSTSVAASQKACYERGVDAFAAGVALTVSIVLLVVVTDKPTALALAVAAWAPAPLLRAYLARDGEIGPEDLL
jgi:hypothetical protein